MTDDRRATIDADIAELLARGAVEAAVEKILEVHGASIYGMIAGVFHDTAVAEDVFQHFSIELWKSLPSFQGRSSVYTWAYVLARRSVTHRLRRKSSAREQRLHTGQQEALVARQWSRKATAEWQRTETKSRFRELCEGLPHEERLLVMLRIGEKMSWKQIARVIHDDGDEATPPDEETLTREAATLRKRFERVKTKLRDALAG